MWSHLTQFVFGERLESDLPERVRESVAKQQIESEKLISWVQLVLVLIFAALFTLAPSTAAEAPFQPVPWALSLYFLFTVIRLGCSYKPYLPAWLLVISVVMDIGLLMVLIWSFHIQYMQPASFYLKAPTMIYVFIFIALRALRFEPRYIVLAGAAAAIGWLVLVLYVIFGVPEDPMITRNYVTYLTSNAILIGAEVDKIISILLVTAVLAVAILRAQRVLNKAVLETTAAHDLSRFVDREVADRITSADQAIQPGDGESRIASVVFTDIEGFSTESEKLSPQELATMLNEYFGAMSEVIDQYGGVITQYQGDLMLITFNAVSSDEDHAANAIKTALGIKEVAEARTFGNGSVLKTRCGINTGEIVVGAIGAENRLSFTVHGDEVNIAARLEQLNKQHGTYIMIGENTVKACGGLFNCREVTEVTVRGRSKPTRVYTVDGPASDSSISTTSKKPAPAGE